MSDFYLDVGLLSLTAVGTSEEEVEKYVETLTGLQDVALENPSITMRISAYATELLLENDCYPFVDKLPAPAWPQRRDIVQIVGQLLSRLKHIEDDDGIEAILLGQFSCTPDDAFVVGPAGLIAHRNEVLCRCVIHERKTKCGTGPALFTRLNGCVPVDVSIVCSIADVQAREDRLGAIPAEVSGNVAVAGSLVDIVATIDSLTLWRLGRFEEAIHFAAHKELSTLGWPLLTATWSFGKEFFESARQCGCDADPTRSKNLLKACVDSISGQRLQAVHAIRVSPGGAARQRTRKCDSANAWRRDIDHEYHLHYWATSSGIFFAKVVPHGEISIPEE